MSCSCSCACRCSLVECVASANTINGAMGVWPYRLFLVRRQWDGGEPGRGALVDVRLELGCNGSKAEPGDCVSPADVRMPSTSVRRSFEGTVATDSIMVESLDGGYSEHALAPVADHVVGEEIFYEVVPARDFENDLPKAGAAVTRCAIVGRPVITNDGLNWGMKLRIQQPSASFGGASP